MKVLKSIVFLILALIILGSIFYIGDYITKLRYSNQKIIEIIKQEDLKLDNPLNEVLFKLQQIYSTFTQSKKKIEEFVSIFPKVKEDVALRENFLEIIKNLQCFSNYQFLKDGLSQKEEALLCLQTLKEKLNAIKGLNLKVVEEFEDKIITLLEFLGEKEKKAYLVLLQYPVISRPTGGFLSSYGVLEFDKGKIRFEGGHIIELDNLFNSKIIPPRPLQLIENQWFFHDLNWFYDLSLSGEKLINNFNEATSYKTEGLILINPEVIKEILKTTGEITLKEYPFPISYNNFESFLKEELINGMKPGPLRIKPIVLDEFFNLLFEKLREINSDQLEKLIDNLIDLKDQKEIQFYFKNQKFNDLFNIPKESESKNFVGVTFSYLNKELKEDARPKKVALKTELNEDGRFVNQINISAEATNLSEKRILTYLKVYLPKDIELIETTGWQKVEIKDLNDYFKKLNYLTDQDVLKIEENQIHLENIEAKISLENNKTVIEGFANISVEPINIKYYLKEMVPVNEQSFPFEIEILKQSGQNVKFIYNLLLPKNYKLGPNLFTFDKWLNLNKDLVIKFIIEKNEKSL